MSLYPGFKGIYKVSEYLIKSRSLFQSMGDAHAEDLSPLVEVLDLGTDRLVDLEE